MAFVAEREGSRSCGSPASRASCRPCATRSQRFISPVSSAGCGRTSCTPTPPRRGRSAAPRRSSPVVAAPASSCTRSTVTCSAATSAERVAGLPRHRDRPRPGHRPAGRGEPAGAGRARAPRRRSGAASSPSSGWGSSSSHASRATRTPAAIRARIGVSADRFVVGWFGRMTAVKRTDDLLDALAALRSEASTRCCCSSATGPTASASSASRTAAGSRSPSCSSATRTTSRAGTRPATRSCSRPPTRGRR